MSSQRFYLDSSIMTRRRDVERLAVYSEPINVRFTMPAINWEVTHSYPRRYVYSIQDATIDPLSNLVYDSHGQLIAESSSEFPIRRLYDWPYPRLRPRRKVLRGEFVFLPTNPNLYHWLEDLAVFGNSLARSPQARILVPRGIGASNGGWNQRFQELTNHLSPSRMLFIGRPVTVERLILTGRTGGLGSPTNLQTLHPADVESVRRLFREWFYTGDSLRSYYLSRRGFARSPRDEARLESLAAEHGFEVVLPSELSLRDQVHTFSGANTIAGLHGAALANMIWMRPDSNLIELFESSYVPAHFSCLASITRTNYFSAQYSLSSQGDMGESFVAAAADLLRSKSTGTG